MHRAILYFVRGSCTVFCFSRLRSISCDSNITFLFLVRTQISSWSKDQILSAMHTLQRQHCQVAFITKYFIFAVVIKESVSFYALNVFVRVLQLKSLPCLSLQLSFILKWRDALKQKQRCNMNNTEPSTCQGLYNLISKIILFPPPKKLYSYRRN